MADEVRNFILNDVLVPNEDWERGIKGESFDAAQTREILLESLGEAQKRGSLYPVVEEELREAFYAVIRNRWHCPFPFIFLLAHASEARAGSALFATGQDPRLQRGLPSARRKARGFCRLRLWHCG